MPSKRLLVLIRHGKAHATAESGRDFDRALKREGKLALRATLAQLPKIKLAGRNAQIWASPALRTRQTALIAAKALGLPEDDCPLREREFLWLQDETAFFDELTAEAPHLPDVLLVVGHNPFMESVACALTGAGLSFAPGAALALEVDGEAPLANARMPRMLFFAQGVPAEPFATLALLESALKKAAKAVDKRRLAFLADPSDPETLHQFRISIRKLRSLLAFIEPFTAKTAIGKAQRSLRKIVLKTSDLRDLDILLEQVETLDCPAQDLVDVCRALRRSACDAVAEALSRDRCVKTLRGIAQVSRRPPWKKGVFSKGIESEELKQSFAEELASFRAEQDVADPTDVEGTHALRKHAKKLRYIAESLKGAVCDEAALKAEMQSLQDSLGALCDARTLKELIADVPRRIERLSDDERSIGKLSDEARCDLGLLEARQQEAIYTILKSLVNQPAASGAAGATETDSTETGVPEPGAPESGAAESDVLESGAAESDAPAEEEGRTVTHSQRNSGNMS